MTPRRPRRPALTIARYTMLEGLRNRLLWLFAALALLALAGAGFLNALALTESRQIQLALLAAALRLAAVFLMSAFVVTSVQREGAEKGRQLLLALPLRRADYLLGKLGGYAMLALLPALLFGALALPYAPPAQCALWSLTLLCELWIMAGFSLLCALGLRHSLPALAATAAFYLLARSVGGLQLLAHAAPAGAARWNQGLAGAVDLLALLLPRLDDFARTEWLVYHSGGAAALGGVLLQTGIYLALLGAAALLDLHRKPL